MFGIQNETKTEEKKHSNGVCYGGYGSRLAYEQFCREQRAGRAGRIARSTAAVCVCLMFGMVGMLGGLLVYDLVDSNKALYYPRGSMPMVSGDTSSDENDRFSTIEALRDTMPMPGVENVTHELSSKYRVPVGVMIHEVEEFSTAETAGILSGDIIVSIDGIEVINVDMLDFILTESSEPVKLTVFRNNQYVDLVWDYKE